MALLLPAAAETKTAPYFDLVLVCATKNTSAENICVRFIGATEFVTPFKRLTDSNKLQKATG